MSHMQELHTWANSPDTAVSGEVKAGDVGLIHTPVEMGPSGNAGILP